MTALEWATVANIFACVAIARVNARNLQLLNTFQFMYLESPRDTYDGSNWMAGTLRITPGLLDLWNSTKADYDEDFAKFFDANVVAGLDR